LNLYIILELLLSQTYTLIMIAFFIILYSTITFTSWYSVTKYSPLYWEHISRINSSVHASLATYFSIMLLCSFSNNYANYWLLYSNSLVYLLFDNFLLYYQKHVIHVDKFIVLHHILFLTGLNYAVWVRSDVYILARFLLTEISTPMLNYAWSVYKLPYQHHPLETPLSKFLLFISYLGGRIFNLGHLLLFNSYPFLSLPQFYIVSFFLLNVYWFFKLLSKV